MSGARSRCLSLFSGAGGLDLGFESAGFEHIGCVERDKDSRETLVGNRPDWPLLPGGDIIGPEPSQILKDFGIERGEVEVVIAGPPCQPFSKSAFWVNGTTARLQDPRADTLWAMMDL